MNGVCETSLYYTCRCKEKYHLPIGLPLYDAHCHIDLFFNYGLNQTELTRQLSDGRRMTFIDNRHHHHRWFVEYELQIPGATVYTTYGIHPKYLPSNMEQAAQNLNDIFQNGVNVNTITVGVGECGLDETSSWSYDQQLLFFRRQLRLATEFQLPLVLHGRGQTVFALMLDEMRLHLDQTHRIHWHCINPKSDLTTVSRFLEYFPNSFIGLNCSSLSEPDIALQNAFNTWLLGQPNILARVVLETDYPFLKPSCLTPDQYNPVSGITLTAQHLVNVLRRKKMNATKVIDQSNNNIRILYGID